MEAQKRLKTKIFKLCVRVCAFIYIHLQITLKSITTTKTELAERTLNSIKTIAMNL